MKILAKIKPLINQKACLKLPAKMLFLISIISGLLFLLIEAKIIYRKTEQSLEKSQLKIANQAVIFFEKVFLTPHSDQNITIWQNTSDVRSLAHFNNSIFVATDGGLLELSETGALLRHFMVLDGLPESDLTSLSVFQSKLFIGTKSKDLLSFDGENFVSLRLQNHETKAISALFSDEQTLFIGTFAGGLLEFDGKKFVETKAGEQRIEHVTFLENNPSRLLVGTFDDGLWIRQSGIWKHFTAADGLLSNRIVGTIIIGENIFVGTDLGVSQGFLSEIFQENQKVFHQSAVLPTLSSLIAVSNQIFLVKDDGEIFTFPNETKFLNALKFTKIEWKKSKNIQNARLLKIDRELWLESNQGIWKNSENDSNNLSLTAFGIFFDEPNLTENTISALMIDENERLWCGTFRNGIDVFSANGKKLKHLESESVREINFFAQDFDKKTVFAATSGGIVKYNSNFSDSISNDEFPRRSITQISLGKIEKTNISAIATAKGLLLKDDNSSRIFSTVNGLPGNSTFTTLFARNSIFVGTIGGLAQIENGKIVRVFKTSNSELKNNWITALTFSNERIFIGTYGGGIYELLPSGEIHSFSSETGNLFVNQNAIFSDEERLYVGTLEGVWILNFASQKWSQIKEILPSQTVLSMTGNRESIFFGTTNGIAQINKNFWSKN